MHSSPVVTTTLFPPHVVHKSSSWSATVVALSQSRQRNVTGTDSTSSSDPARSVWSETTVQQ
jgi:hypothetical protein